MGCNIFSRWIDYSIEVISFCRAVQSMTRGAKLSALFSLPKSASFPPLPLPCFTRMYDENDCLYSALAWLCLIRNMDRDYLHFFCFEEWKTSPWCIFSFLHFSAISFPMFSISLFVTVVPYSLVSPKDTVIQSMTPGIDVPLFCSEGRYKPYRLALVCDLNWIAFLRRG